MSPFLTPASFSIASTTGCALQNDTTESATVKAAAQLVAASLRRDGEIAGTSARLYAEADGLAAGLHRPPSSPDPRA